MRRATLLLVFLGLAALGQNRPSSCSSCPEWNKPQKPFRIYANSYYVGTHGLGSVLITSSAGHILIDGALPESEPLIVANIKALGFRVEDVKLILNSHVHFDHAGSIPELHKLTGARVAASPWTADVMRKGKVPRDDPQFGIIRDIGRVEKVETIKEGQTLSVGEASATAHFTPGHTRGGTTWTWTSCESGRCLNLVYADSLTAVSADGFRFTHNTVYPEAIADFQRGFQFLDTVPCDILITPHPELSNLWERLAARGTNPNALIDPKACHVLADSMRERLRKRLDSEKAR
jgi:metallo-beta-lactamase class B